MEEVSMVGVDLVKRVFQVHGAAAGGNVIFRKKLGRGQFLAFLAKLPACTVAMEACATSHFGGREIERLGHAVRLIPPIYVKPFVKRQKNDSADAEAIAEAASRPTMRFVAVKTEDQQAGAMVFRTRDLLVRQRTQLINALRGHLAEYGIVAAQGAVHLKTLRGARGSGSRTAGDGARHRAALSRSDRAMRREDRRPRDVHPQQGRRDKDGDAPPDHARDRADRRDGDRGLRAADAGVPQGPRLRRLAGPRAATEIDRRQADPRQDLKDGPARHPKAADHLRHGRGACCRRNS